jgi:uncharacterized protein involved in exopolysaccharide biosynthesis
VIAQESPLPDETSEQLSSVAALLRRALRCWRTALSVLVLGGIACAVFLVVRHPTYRSETVILYSEGARPGDDAERPDTARSVTFRLKEILMSRASLDVLVRAFDLYPDVQKSGGPIDAVEELKKHVEFKAPGGDTFSLAFTGASPSEAQAVTARLAEVVIGQDADLRKKQAGMVRDFLKTEQAATEDSLREAELALASFMAAHPRFALDATPLATGAAIRASVGATSAPTTALPSGGRAPSFAPRQPTTVTEGATNASSGEAPSHTQDAATEILRARAALAAAQANLADLASRFTPAYPDVRAAQAEVDRATTRLQAATAGAIGAGTPEAGQGGPRTYSPAPVALAREAAPAAATDRSRGGTVAPAAPAGRSGASEHDVVALETQWVKLTRGATEARQHEDQVEAALFEAKNTADEGDHGVRVIVIDPAFLPQTAVPPGRTMIVALFAAVSLLLAAIGALLKALLGDRVYETRDIERFAPVLAEVPRGAHA